MKLYTDAVTSTTTGLPVAGVTVSVKISGTNTAATLFSPDDPNVPLDNPFISASGVYSFYAPDGAYDIAAASNGRSAGIKRVEIFEGLSTIRAASGEPGYQLPPAAQIAGTEPKVLGPDPVSGKLGLISRSLFRGDPGGDTSSVGLFTVLSTLTIGAGITRIRTSGFRREAWGKAAYAQWGAPMANLPAFGEGKWWVKTNGGAKIWYLDPDGDAYFDMFGAYGDDVNDDYPAFLAMQDFCRWRGGAQPNSYYVSGGTVKLRKGNYFSSQSWQLKATYILSGESTGLAGASEYGIATTIRFNGTDGIVVNDYDTFNGATESTPSGGANGTILSGLHISGTSFSAGVGCHAVHAHARPSLIQFTVSDWSGDGIRLVSNDLGGNVNGWFASNVRITRCAWSGFHVQGGDGNAGAAIGLDISRCGNWGIEDRSFLANTYTGCQVDNSGVVGIAGRTAPSWVVHNGGLWVLADGQDAQGGVVEPGTNANVWLPFGTGTANGSHPEWVSGGTYKAGGAGVSISLNAPTTFYGLYTEGSYPPFQTSGPGVFYGGLIASGTLGSYPYIAGRNNTGGLTSTKGFVSFVQGSTALQTTRLGSPNVDTQPFILTDSHSVYSPLSWRLRYSSTGDLTFDYANIFSAFSITGPGTTFTAGRSSPQPYKFATASLILGSGNVGRHHLQGLAPTSGDVAQGDRVNLNNLSPGGKAQSFVTTGGVAGSTAVLKLGNPIDA